MSVPREYESSDCAGDYEEIERAVLESARGRWFLAEYAKRIRAQDTALILDAIHRLEASRVPSAMEGNMLVKPLVSDAVDSPEIAAEALRYYRQDEDVFAPLPGPRSDKPVLRVVEGANPRVTIRRITPETVANTETPVEAAPAPVMEPTRPRIVMIRKATSDLLTIPLADEAPENAVA